VYESNVAPRNGTSIVGPKNAPVGSPVGDASCCSQVAAPVESAGSCQRQIDTPSPAMFAPDVSGPPCSPQLAPDD
jgi:hypothetical protein